MFGCPPRLEVRRPSPTTVEFIVTTQPRRSGWAGWAWTVAVVAVRLALAATAGLVLWVWLGARAAGAKGGGLGPWADAEAWWADPAGAWAPGDGLVGRHLAPLVAPLAARYVPVVRAAAAHVVLPLCAAAAWASVARVHTSESLLVLRGLGIQTRSTGSTYVGELVAGVSLVWWAATTGLWSLVLSALSASASSASLSSSAAMTPCSASAAASASASASALFLLREPLPAATRFIPTEKLQDILVNEAFRGFEVRYYLVAVVAGGAGSSGRRRRRRQHGRKQRRASMDTTGKIDEDYDDDDADDDGMDDGRDGHANEDDDDDDLDLDFDVGSDADDCDSDCDSSSEDDEDHVVVVFPRLLPGLDIVRTVWREARACLYEPDAKG